MNQGDRRILEVGVDGEEARICRLHVGTKAHGAARQAPACILEGYGARALVLPC